MSKIWKRDGEPYTSEIERLEKRVEYLEERIVTLLSAAGKQAVEALEKGREIGYSEGWVHGAGLVN